MARMARTIWILSFLIFFPTSLFAIKLAIMDFTTVDIEAQRYLQNYSESRASYSRQKLSVANRARYKNVKTEYGRQVIIGAELLTAELFKYPDDFEIIDRKRIEESLNELKFQSSDLVASDTARQIGQMTGATHLVYGIVNDFSVEKRAYSGYDIKTRQIVYSIDLVVKVVEVETNKVAFSDNVTNRIVEVKTKYASHENKALAKRLMKGALQKVAAHMDEYFTSNPSTAVRITLPEVSITPRNPEGKKIYAEVEIDGEYVGNAPLKIKMKSGRHTIKITADGYKDWEKIVTIADKKVISPRLSKKNN